MNFEAFLQSKDEKIPVRSAHAVLELVGEGATVPFIARYRKEKTGNLDEVAIQTVIDAKEDWDHVLKRQTFIVEEIEKQGKLTPELKERVLATFEAELLEDIYLPYKVKRKTKAALAREAGLEPLADWLWNCAHGTETPLPGQTLEIWAFTFRNEDKGFKDAASALDGAQDILIERLSERQELRQKVRTALTEHGFARTAKASKAKPNSKYETYFSHHETIASLLKPENSHRYLAMRRGWIEEELTLTLGGAPDDPEFENALLRDFEVEACTVNDSICAEVLLKAARMAFKVHVLNSIENELHRKLREVADQVAVKVFAENVRRLLLASPFGPKAVLGIDPGVRTGCKMAVVDNSGQHVADAVIHLQSEEQKTVAKELIPKVIATAGIQAVAVGNGTAGRETEAFVRSALKAAGLSVPVVMVSESGASVYSASDVAREEFPNLDLTVRGAISIARRLQDPLAELVKVDPKAIGVGQYQHDVSPHALKKSLDLVVDSCVNSVGVNLNTASPYLLARVAGIGDGLARGIVEYRNQHGLFKSRQELLEVSRFSKKAFEQAAGFLRVPNAENPLDNTAVHPERYSLVEARAKALGHSVSDLMGSGVAALRKDDEFRKDVGEFTFNDIISELERPGRDPREEFVPFSFRDDIFAIKDLQPGMICPGIVTNVTNFGAFVDIGVHQDGLVHISQLSDKFVKDPREVVSPGDRVTIRVLEANLEKNQISLSMKGTQPAAVREPRPPRAAKAPRAPRAPRVPEQKPMPKQEGPPKPSPIKPQAPGSKPMITSGRDRRPMPSERKSAAFNNPFASALAGLKDSLKSGKRD